MNAREQETLSEHVKEETDHVEREQRGENRSLVIERIESVLVMRQKVTESVQRVAGHYVLGNGLRTSDRGNRGGGSNSAFTTATAMGRASRGRHSTRRTGWMNTLIVGCMGP